MMENFNSQIVIYKDKNGHIKIDVRFDGDTVWLTQDAIAILYNKGRSTITEHIQNIFQESELDMDSVCREFRRTGSDGKKYLVQYYNLDLIIAVGYRARSSQGIAFRKWATERLSQYIVKGFVLDDERLKQSKHFGKDYYDNLLERIREIRISERRLYTVQA